MHKYLRPNLDVAVLRSAGPGPRPLLGRSAWTGTRWLGITPRPAPFHALRAGTARGPWVRAATGPRSQRSAWHARVGIYPTPCSFPRAARQGRRAARWGSGRDRSPVAALGLAREGWDLPHTLLLSTRCAPGTARGPWVRAATGPRSQRSAWHEEVGISPHLASFHALRARDGARSVGVRAATGPRSQRSAWHEGVGIYTTTCSFPRAARQGRRAVRTILRSNRH